MVWTEISAFAPLKGLSSLIVSPTLDSSQKSILCGRKVAGEFVLSSLSHQLPNPKCMSAVFYCFCASVFKESRKMPRNISFVSIKFSLVLLSFDLPFLHGLALKINVIRFDSFVWFNC